MAQRNSHVPPVPPSSFVGRHDEVRQVVERLTHPDCRLLTLVGLGGIGKTRLALQLATRLADHFADGTHFIPLQGVTRPEFLSAAIADGLALSLAGQIAPLQQLQHQLHDQEMLLILDSFEHLLEGAETITALLAAAPGIQLLVTSRERLNLQQECVWPVRGLSLPDSPDDEHLEQYGAIQLFVERARQVRPTFSIEDERDSVVAICQFTEGMPLALELAALWVRTLRCAEITAKMRTGLQFLSNSWRDVPERHHSLSIVFEQSWQLLSEQEQAVFARLALFVGGFTTKAAAEVAGASLSVLAALVDKSLLHWDPNGRYQMHQLLREFAQEQLANSPDAARDATTRYYTYYSELLHMGLPAMNGEHQLEATAEIEAALANIRQAWDWMVTAGDVEAIRLSEQTLYLFYQFQSRYQEGAAAFEQAACQLDDLPPDDLRNQTLAQILVDMGWLCIRLGELETAQHMLERSATLYNTTSSTPPATGMATHPLIPLGVLDLLRGEYGQAAHRGFDVLTQSTKRGDKGNRMFAHYVLTSALLAQGELPEAQNHALKAYELVRVQQNDWFAAYCLIELGNVSQTLNEIDEAKKHYQASFAIREQFNDREGMAIGLSHLGSIALTQQEYREASDLFQRSLILYENLGDKGGLARAMEGMGRTTSALGEYDAARRYFVQALRTAQQTSIDTLQLSILISTAELLLRTGEASLAKHITAYVQRHDASTCQLQHRVRQLTFNLPEAEARSCNLPDSIPQVVEAVLKALSASSDDQRADLAPLQHNLITPLTPRELEVLHLLGNGLSNREIAQELVLAVGTVKSHVHRIYGKLAVKNRTQAAARARELNLI